MDGKRTDIRAGDNSVLILPGTQFQAFQLVQSQSQCDIYHKKNLLKASLIVQGLFLSNIGEIFKHQMQIIFNKDFQGNLRISKEMYLHLQGVC